MCKKENECIFCNLEKPRVIVENDLAVAIWDDFPVTDYHSLIIPRRHVSSYFDLTEEELLACNALVQILQKQISERDNSVDGYNVGVNVGETAGQSIFHCHIHLIPRRKGDVKDPKGGVRHTIPGKGFY